MTLPRKITAGYAEVCSRTLERRLAFLPRHDVKQIFEYVMACAAERYAVDILCICVMGSHYHALLYDRLGVLPKFMMYANSLIAKALNARYGRDDKFISADGYGLLRPQQPDDLLERYTYILANPAAANLVQRGTEYPNIWTGPKQIGTTRIIAKPDHFFRRKRSKMPDEVPLTICVPDCFKDRPVAEFRTLVRDRLLAEEKRLRVERRKAGISVLGAERLRKVRWHDTPKAKNAWFTLNPRIAAKDRDVRIAAIRELQLFRSQYRIAWQAFQDGNKESRFPPGTWWMIQYGQCCTGLPPG